MSKGIGAHANMVAEDKNTVIYEYGGYNLNDPKYRNEDHLYDGVISIQRDCFAEPEIQEKVKKILIEKLTKEYDWNEAHRILNILGSYE